MKVTYIFRRKVPHWFSIERYFRDVRAALPQEVEHETLECPCESKGLWPRIRNVWHTAWHRGNEINHITGDVHYVALFLPRRRTVLSINDCVTLERMQGLRRKLFLFLWYWLPVRRSALISVISEATKQELLRWVKCPPEKIRVVHCPVSSSFTPAPASYHEDCPVVLQIGTTQNKNLLRVAEALRGIHCHLRIIGPLTAEQREALETNQINFSQVQQLSEEEVIREYQNCDLVLFASTYEGFGLPIVEAQSVGRPVVTSNLLSMPEVAADAACLVDPFDVESIRAGVLRVMQDQQYREDLVQRGFANVGRFQADKIATEFVKIYEELAA